jgi:hypothetical protein
MVEKPSNETFALAFAPLMEVRQGGVDRPATPADLLEVLEPPRYLLKDAEGHYLGDRGAGWVRRQRRAVVIPAIEDAREARRIGREEYGVDVRIVRLRRRGTKGIEGYRLRQNLDVRSENGLISFNVTNKESMDILAVLTGGAKRQGEA